MSNKNNRIRTLYIYLTTNLLDGRNYVGQRHCPVDKTPETDTKYYGSGNDLRPDLVKFGKKNFSKEILAVCYDGKILDILEQQYIKLYRSIGKAEYNRARGGQGISCISHTEEWKQMMSEKFKGRPLSEEQKRKISETRKGQKLTERTKLKLVKCRERRSLLIEMSPLRQRENIERYWLPVKKKENVFKTGVHWYNNGQTCVKAKECPEGFVPGRIGNFACSEEAKRKKSEWWKNLSQDEREAYKKNHSEGLKGHVCSTETRERISAAKKGKPGRAQSEESKAKISAALKGRKQEISYA